MFVIVFILIPLICLALFLWDLSKAKRHQKGLNKFKTIYGFKNYTQIELGNVNIMISVPHDGTLKPSTITDRKSDKLRNLSDDDNTRLIGQTIRDELSNLFLIHQDISIKPFMVINNLIRKKMDPNRKLIEACFDTNEESSIAYTNYHGMIEDYFCKGFMVKSSFEQGILLDIHGQTHEEKWIELGYLLSSDQLNEPILSNEMSSRSSIYKLSKISDQSYDSLVRGNDFSLGGIMQSRFNFKVVPSPKYPTPGGSKYYKGGFITEKYGSLKLLDYRLSAIQLELPTNLRHGKKEEIIENSKKLAACIYDFYCKNCLYKKLHVKSK